MLSFLKCIIFKFLYNVDGLLGQIYSTLEARGITDNSLLLEIIILLYIFIITILLGIDTDTINNEKLYRKKYLIMIYSIITLLFIINRSELDFTMLVLSIFLILFINAISAINIGYNIGTKESERELVLLEKELGLLSTLLFYFKSWLYKTQTYISVYALIFLFINNNYIYNYIYTLNIIGLNYLNEILMIIIISTFFFLHILMDMRDRFDYENFNVLENKLKGTIATFNETLQKDNLSVDFNINEIDINFIETLGLLLYIEDRDFISRKRPKYSSRLVFIRKIKNIISNSNVKINNLNENMKSKKTIKDKICFLIEYIKMAIKKIYNNMATTIRNLISNTFRGFSTLEQQVVRRTIMKSYTYNYTFRRKFFIENNYIKYFIKAYEKRKIKDERIKRNWTNYIKSSRKRKIEKNKKNKRKLIIYKIKLEILIYYYVEIMENPKDSIELLEQIYLESGQTRESLFNKKKIYDNSNYKDYITNQIKTKFNF